MASRAHDLGRASALPLSAVLATIPSYPRAIIERLVARLIEHLDATDGDADLEPDGDELDGSTAADDWHNGSRRGGLSSIASVDCEDAEDDTADCCTAGDDGVFSGPAFGNPFGYASGMAGTDEDTEVVTWSHPDDHPPELFIGKRATT